MLEKPPLLSPPVGAQEYHVAKVLPGLKARGYYLSPLAGSGGRPPIIHLLDFRRRSLRERQLAECRLAKVLFDFHAQ